MTMTRFLALAALAATLAMPAPVLAQSETYYAGVVQNPTVNAPPAQVVARFTLPPMPNGGIQDFSGIATRDGVNLMLVSDHGFLAIGRLERGYGQQIQGFTVQRVAPLVDYNGVAVHGSRRDAEDITVDRRGRIYVSFEQYNRVDMYAGPGAPAQPLGQHPDFDRMRAGAALEAVAIDRNGVLYAIPERPARATYGFPSYRLQNGEWTGSFRLPQEYGFEPVSADFGPDGLLYVLERERGAQGLRAQVRRFSIQGRAISTPQVVMRSDYNQFGNLEGLAVFRDWSGRIRLMMVSDNDLSTTRPSEIVDVVLNRG